MTKKLKIAAATAAVSIAGLSLAACGSSSDGSADAATGAQTASQQTGVPPMGSTGPSGATGSFESPTSDDVKCLKKQGVTVPSGPPKAGSGGKPSSGMPSKANMSTPAEMKNAAKACGIDLPTPGAMGAPGGPPSGQGKMAPPQGTKPPSGGVPSGQPPVAAGT